MRAARRYVVNAVDAPPNNHLLRHALRWWCCFGVIVVICVPAARGSSLWIGSVPYWLVAAPLFSMLVQDRQWLRESWMPRISARLMLGKDRSSLRRNRRVRVRIARGPNALRASLAALVGGRR